MEGAPQQHTAVLMVLSDGYVKVLKFSVHFPGRCELIKNIIPKTKPVLSSDRIFFCTPFPLFPGS